MKSADLTGILKDLENGLISAKEAESRLSDYNFVDVGSITLDLGREKRCGSPEVIYGEAKTSDQLTAIGKAFSDRKTDVLFSRLRGEQLPFVQFSLPDGRYNKSSRTFLWRAPGSKLPLNPRASFKGSDLDKVVIVSAGASDAFVVDEICETLFLIYGEFPEVISDCGVAGIHRILSHGATLAEARVVVTVAGMDGALPTVTAGMTKAPVIAVPTSVGYGPLGNGIAPLISMLASCAPGLLVVNVDNGVGAAFAVSRILGAIEL